ncbi:MAG: zf-HC2 domain-containing protein [Spirochaetaceae bacterium]|nr:zf-HC2 domain-containing protein [Spirochaetaceae bacterium]
MCPDHEILSVFLDGELPSPWKEKMEQHLAGCAACRARLDTYRKLSQIMGGVSAPAGEDGGFESVLASARTRVWEKLEKDLGGASEPPGVEAEFPRLSVWQRRLSIPLPAAAAALLLILATAFFASRPLFSPPRQNEMAGIETDMQSIIPVSDMSNVLQYLENQDTDRDIVIIRLPESRNFTSSGEPTLIRAVDYSRRNQSR